MTLKVVMQQHLHGTVQYDHRFTTWVATTALDYKIYSDLQELTSDNICKN